VKLVTAQRKASIARTVKFEVMHVPDTLLWALSILQRPIFNLDTLEKHFDKASGMASNSNILVYYKRTMKKSDISTYC
jgi:hypothetical protein